MFERMWWQVDQASDEIKDQMWWRFLFTIQAYRIQIWLSVTIYHYNIWLGWHNQVNRSSLYLLFFLSYDGNKIEGSKTLQWASHDTVFPFSNSFQDNGYHNTLVYYRSVVGAYQEFLRFGIYYDHVFVLHSAVCVYELDFLVYLTQTYWRSFVGNSWRMAWRQ